MSSEFRVPGSESPSLVRKGGLGRVGLLSCLALLLMAGGTAQATLTTDLDFATVNASGSTAAAVNLNNVAGAIDATAGALSNATGATPVIDINATSANVALGPSVTNTTGISVEVTNSGSAAVGGNIIALTGAISDTGTGVRLDNNDQNTNGATVRFGGALTLNTGASIAFNAINGGRVEATGSGSVITTTTGTGVNIANTTIGTSGVTFRSVSSSGGGNPGIVLDATGAGSYAVTGDGSGASNGSGGTIVSKTGDAIFLNAASDVSLSHMNIGQAGALGNIEGNGIRAISVNGFSLNRSNLQNIANQSSPDEAALFATNPQGTWSVINTLFDRSFDDHIRIENSTTTSGFTFNLLDSTLQDNDVSGNGNDALLYIADGGNTNATFVVQRNLFDDSDGDHIQVALGGMASANVTIGGADPANGNTMTATAGGVLGSGITLSSGTDSLANGFQGTLTYLIQNNDIQNAAARAINVNLSASSTAGMRYSGTIADNVVGTPGTANASGGFGIGVVQNGAGTLNATISNNSIAEYDGDHGLLMEARDGSGRLNAVVTGNSISNPFDGAVFDGIGMNAGATATDTSIVCADISANSIIGAGPGGADFAIFSVNSAPAGAQIILPGYGGAAKDNAAIVAFVQGRNDANPADGGVQAPAPTGTTFFTANSQGVTGVGSCN